LLRFGRRRRRLRALPRPHRLSRGATCRRDRKRSPPSRCRVRRPTCARPGVRRPGRRPPSPSCKPNNWPEQPAALRDLCAAYNRGSVRWASICAPRALALDLAEHHLDGYFADPSMNAAVPSINSRPAGASDCPAVCATRPHTTASVTRLRQDEAPAGSSVRLRRKACTRCLRARRVSHQCRRPDVAMTTGVARDSSPRRQPVTGTDGQHAAPVDVVFFKPHDEIEIACCRTCATSTARPRLPPVKAGDIFARKSRDRWIFRPSGRLTAPRAEASKPGRPSADRVVRGVHKPSGMAPTRS